MLGVVHQGVADPLLWKMLEKKGNSNSNERMDLLDRFREVFPDTEVAYICGDREFVGKQWLDYLRSIVTDLDLKHDDFIHSLKFLSRT